METHGCGSTINVMLMLATINVSPLGQQAPGVTSNSDPEITQKVRQFYNSGRDWGRSPLLENY